MPDIEEKKEQLQSGEAAELDEGALEAQKLMEESEIGSREPSGWQAWVIPIIAAAWSIFQLSLAASGNSFLSFFEVFSRWVSCSFKRSRPRNAAMTLFCMSLILTAA